MTKAEKEIRIVRDRLTALNNEAGLAEARALRRAALTLHRWYENECNGVIQREGDDGEGKPFWYNPNTGKRVSSAPDREKGAIKTIKRICDRLGLHYYLQTDPRGGTLYVDIKPIEQTNYNRATFLY